MDTQRCKRVLMLCSRHSAFDGRVFHLEARTLRDAGYDVTIAAPRLHAEPESKDGIRIITFLKTGGPARKIITIRSLASIAVKAAPDVLHVHELDASLIAAAWAKKRLVKMGKQVSLILDSHEVWPYYYNVHGPVGSLAGLMKHIVLAYENWMLQRHVDAVITAHEIEKNYYLWLNPWIPVRKVLGSPPIETWGPPPERSGPIKVIGHDGQFSLKRGMDIILNAFEIVADAFADVRLLIAGSLMTPEDENWFHRWLDRTGLSKRVEFTGWIDRSEVLQYLDRMDIGVIANIPDVHSVRCWPSNKMMYYLGRGLPVASTPAPLYVRYIEDNGCGSTARDFSAIEMANILMRMIKDSQTTRSMGRRAYQAALRDFNSKQSASELLKLYREVESIRPHPSSKSEAGAK